MPNQEPLAANAKSKGEKDTWFGVQDARTRKLIQDRLAQRARRKRLADSKSKPQVKEPSHGGSLTAKLAPKVIQPMPAASEAASSVTEVARTAVEHQHGPSIVIGLSNSEAPSLEGQLNPYSIPHACLTLGPVTYHPGTDPYFLNMPSFTLFSALHNNSRLLGISCLFPLPRQSPLGSSELPLSLHPVSLQMEVHHLPYIDCLPLPQLRHNLILFNGLVDDETFCLDLTTSSNFIVGGSQSWEPSGWIISPEFKERWAVLFN